MTRYLTPAEIAAALGISRSRAYRLLPSLPRVRIGRAVRVSEHDLEAYLRRNKVRPWEDSTDDTTEEPGTATTRPPKESASSEASEPAIAPSPKSGSDSPSWVRPLKRAGAGRG